MTCFIALISFIVPLFAIWAPLGLAPLLATAALLGLPLFRYRIGAWPDFQRAMPTFLAVFAVWSFVTLAWTLDFPDAVRKLASLVLLVALGLAWRACTRRNVNERIVSISIIAGTTLAIVLVFLEKNSGAPVYRLFAGELPTGDVAEFFNRFNRGMTVIALLVWPAARAAGRFHPFAEIVLLFMALCLSAYMNSGAAVLALLLGTVAYFLVWLFHRRQIMWWLGALAATAILLAPVAVDRIPGNGTNASIKASLPNSAYHRLLIWKFTSDRIDERWFFGWGFNASRSIPDAAKNIESNLPGLPLHPHNAALQWRLELGLPGAILGSLMVLFMFGAGQSYKSRKDRAMAAGTLVSGVTIAFLSYGIWQSWWVAALLLVAACMPPSGAKGLFKAS